MTVLFVTQPIIEMLRRWSGMRRKLGIDYSKQTAENRTSVENPLFK
jgi:hypothetical protein